MSRPIRVAIIGTGRVAYKHAHGLLNGNGCELAAACDSNPENLAKFAAEFKIPQTCRDIESLLRFNFDAAVLLTPHDQHLPMGRALLNAGKHLLIEKPIARTLDETDELINAAKSSSCTLMVGHNQRFYPNAIRVRELIASNAIGKVFLASAWHHQNFSVAPGHWWRSKESVGGGCLIGSGIHRLDLLRWYLGEVEEVFAHGCHDQDRLEGEVAASATLRFQSGAIATFLCNWGLTAAYSKTRFGESLTLFGKSGHLSLPDYSNERVTAKLPGEDERDIVVDAAAQPTMWQHFLHCIRSGDQPLTNALEARQSLALVLAISKSIETGTPVRVAA